MKLYEFSVTQISDGAMISNNGNIFSDFSLAEKALKDFVKDEDNAIRQRPDFSNWVCDDGEPYTGKADNGSFSVGVDGQWCLNSTDAYIEPHDVDVYVYVVTSVYNTNYNGVHSNTEVFDTIEKSNEYAKKIQETFCNEYGIDDNDRVDHVWGEDYDTQWDEIDGCGEFITENNDADRLTITIERKLVG